ncbi:unnamed protein product [Meloidogyne enterolobii]|uniref:Uncharacterized protein n=1 Tax=Meloidogyne enterolobii TaxID=390850 RepID=A0ACB0YSH0_MELEN
MYEPVLCLPTLLDQAPTLACPYPWSIMVIVIVFGGLNFVVFGVFFVVGLRLLRLITGLNRRSAPRGIRAPLESARRLRDHGVRMHEIDLHWADN